MLKGQKVASADGEHLGLTKRGGLSWRREPKNRGTRKPGSSRGRAGGRSERGCGHTGRGEKGLLTCSCHGGSKWQRCPRGGGG